jgi:hypothetical protein
MLGGLIGASTPDWADEPLKITGEVKEVENDGTRLQIIPTNKGEVIVMGEAVKGRLANAVLLQATRPAEIKVTPHDHTQVMVVHQAWEAELARQSDCIKSCP